MGTQQRAEQEVQRQQIEPKMQGMEASLSDDSRVFQQKAKSHEGEPTKPRKSIGHQSPYCMQSENLAFTPEHSRPPEAWYKKLVRNGMDITDIETVACKTYQHCTKLANDWDKRYYAAHGKSAHCDYWLPDGGLGVPSRQNARTCADLEVAFVWDCPAAVQLDLKFVGWSHILTPINTALGISLKAHTQFVYRPMGVATRNANRTMINFFNWLKLGLGEFSASEWPTCDCKENVSNAHNDINVRHLYKWTPVVLNWLEKCSNKRIDQKPRVCRYVDSHGRRPAFDYSVTGFWFRAKFWAPSRESDCLPWFIQASNMTKIVVHSRRGDMIIFGSANKVQTDKSFVNILKEVAKVVGSALSIHIISTSEVVVNKNGKKSLGEVSGNYIGATGKPFDLRKAVIEALGVKAVKEFQYHLDTDTFVSAQHMIGADIFIGSASGFSVLAGLVLSLGIKFFPIHFYQSGLMAAGSPGLMRADSSGRFDIDRFKRLWQSYQSCASSRPRMGTAKECYT